MGNVAFHRRLKIAKDAGLMPSYPADFTLCGCAVSNHPSGVPAGEVRDLGRGKRECAVCGVQWEGDIKRHSNLPPVPDTYNVCRFQGKVK